MGKLKLYSFNHLDSQKPMKLLERTEANGEPMATLSIWLYNLSLERKWVCDLDYNLKWESKHH